MAPSPTGKIRLILLLLSTIGIYAACTKSLERPENSAFAVNIEHALALVDSVGMDGDMVAYVNIYAEYPDYAPVVALGEGITAVDDVGRLLEVLEGEIMDHDRGDLVYTARMLTDFLIKMQKSDGLWFNFIFADGSINTTHKNSVASFGWWAARGLRGYAAAYHIFKDRDPEYAHKLLTYFARSDRWLDKIIASYPQMVSTPLGDRATWLPFDAPDMAAEYLLALAKISRHSYLDYSDIIGKLAEGLMSYQFVEADSPLNGMYFCFGNVWHQWGNLQAFALLEAYALTQNSIYLESVILWADGFLSWEADEGYYWELTVEAPHIITKNRFPQIAYGIGSSYRGIKRLASITHSDDHKLLAEKVLSWFAGDNIPNRRMYDVTTGRTFDGINDSTGINMNSGAESTIEALLALQAASQ